MDVRRVNDILKIVGTAVGAVSGAILALVPFLSGKPLLIATATVAVLGSLAGAFAAGLGTRAIGTEYQSIADAKAIAKVSMMPPPMVVVQAGPTAFAGPPPSAAERPSQPPSAPST